MPDFQLTDHQRAFIDGDAIYAGETLANGDLVRVRSVAGTLTATKTGAGSAPHIAGFAYNRRTNVYMPTTVTWPSGEKMNVIRGSGRVRCSTARFVGGVLPTVEQRIYGGAGGLMTTTAGTNQAIGRCVAVDPVNDYVGLGAFANQCVIEFFFTPLT